MTYRDAILLKGNNPKNNYRSPVKVKFNDVHGRQVHEAESQAGHKTNRGVEEEEWRWSQVLDGEAGQKKASCGHAHAFRHKYTKKGLETYKWALGLTKGVRKMYGYKDFPL